MRTLPEPRESDTKRCDMMIPGENQTGIDCIREQGRNAVLTGKEIVFVSE